MKNWDTLEADVDRILTKHFTSGRNGRKIKMVVVHHNGGRLDVDGCWQTWQTRQASAHYQVCVDGTIGQLVWDRDTAWHAANGEANRASIGIEHADETTNPWHISDATLDNGAHLVAAICKHYGLGRPEWMVNVFPHSHFSSTECPASIAGDQNAAYMQRA
ncbi:peptidoglycan recognition protein family protein [Bifidobacterium vansinderenii]|uniref:N-acetylmuramoyl-L-alanine amidase n=1 Tax=Bifidobacterium vansinderenii TaxID=1984871 RepID=A0A229W0U5_9BIFI|nr:peptidoglycan recognition family protein [Bifidobacterium vansinderenii]OXN01497.1 N-acetylmuramoyl-L-alanine amidase [Bifidobacterium vansinderenii]